MLYRILGRNSDGTESVHDGRCASEGVTRCTLIIAALIASWAAAAAAEEIALETRLNEQVVFVPLAGGGRGSPTVLITATTYHPPGSGPFSLVVLSHGSPANAAARARMGRYRVITRIQALVERGFAVIVPMRRGFGDTGGDFAERFGRCDAPDFLSAGREAARDLLATVAYAAKLPFVKPDRIILLGQSAGGFASVAAASFNPPGVVAVVNLSGGRGGGAGQYGGEPCAPERMEETIAHFARTIRVPVLWHYAENDQYFGPHHVRRWFLAFVLAGARGKLVMQPPFGEDGHRIFASPAGLPIWTAEFDSFLREIGLGP